MFTQHHLDHAGGAQPTAAPKASSAPQRDSSERQEPRGDQRVTVGERSYAAIKRPVQRQRSVAGPDPDPDLSSSK